MIRRLSQGVLIVGLLSLLVIHLPAQAAVSVGGLEKRGDATVTFDASGPGGTALQGVTSEVTFLDGEKVVLTVALDGLKTGIGLRDKHLREKYLETAKYPKAELSVVRAALKIPDSGGSSQGIVAATFTVHGKTHPVVLSYSIKALGEIYQVSGSFHLNIQDFGIETPSYLGLTVKPQVDARASFQLQHR